MSGYAVRTHTNQLGCDSPNSLVIRIQFYLYFLIATGDTWTPDEKGLMTCILPIKSLSSGPQVAVKVAQERWQAIDNKKL
jgi:hypothetical protein